MPAVILYPYNWLETGIVTVTGALATNPKDRLYDRGRGLRYTDSGTTGDREIPRVDLGASPGAHNALIVAPGHNLHTLGVALSLETAASGAGPWTILDTWGPTSDAAFRRTYTNPGTRFVRLRATNPTGAASITELVLSAGLVLPVPLLKGQDDLTIPNIETFETPAGQIFSTKRGAPRWERTYSFYLTDSDVTGVKTAFTAVQEGALAFPLLDAEGIVRWVQWLDNPLTFTPIKPANCWDATFRFREML